MLKLTECFHQNLIEECCQLYCVNCNSYFTKAEVKRKLQMVCENCSCTLTLDEVCFCIDQLR
jgi:hypothetical protein